MQKFIYFFSFLCFSITSFSAFAQSINLFPVQTTIENGIIEGNYDTKTDIQKYFGIPFAKPPVGDLRWKAPQAVDNWNYIKETKKFSARPIQSIVFGDMNSRSTGLSEDCLYLNVWTPAKRNTKNLPVLVYFYGGGNYAGDASEPRYDGESMAKKGIVVITCNYRLNIFGFFAHPELSAETAYKASGNYGLLDQLAALKWVQKNISAFGGDPKHVTIAGESAGSIDVSYQMASPLSKGLFIGAIGESGAGINPTMGSVPLQEAEKTGASFAQKANCTTLAQLRALSTKDVYELYNESNVRSLPVVVDNYFLPKKTPDVFNAKEQAQIPILVGWNSAEIPGGAFMKGKSYTDSNYISRVKQEFPKDYEEVLKLYPHGSAQEIEQSATGLAADKFISYSTWKWFDLQRSNSNQAVYRYLYSKLRPPLADNSMSSALAGGTEKKNPNVPKPSPALGAPHACEIEYCMGNLPLVKEYAWTTDDYKVSETMQNYFANFIKTGNPNDGKLPEWAAAKSGDSHPPVMILDTESKVVNAKDDARYQLLDKIFSNNN